MTHTPGPWHVGVGNGEGSVFAHEGRMRMEEAGTTLYPICKVFDFDGERDANARLIAAAPDLLRALEALVAESEVLIALAQEHCGDGYIELQPVMLAREAIEKTKVA